MKEYIRYLKSDFYKLRYSWLYPIHVLFPVCGAGLTLTYAKISTSSNFNKMAAFVQIISIAYPFVISIVCQIVADQEMQAGNCQNLLTLSSRIKAIISKLTILLSFGFIATFFTVVLFGSVFPIVTGKPIPTAFFLFMPLVLWGSNFMLYEIYLILAFQFGRNVGISIGAIGSMMSALLQTGLGTGLWYVTPFGVGVHFAENTLTKVLRLSIIASAEIKIGILYCVISTCAILGILIFWFSRYNGRCID